MNRLKRIRLYIHEKAVRVSKCYKKEGGPFRIAVRSIVAVVSESLSAALAALVVAVLTTLASGDPGSTGSFATRQGEYRCEKLPEGSETCLNTASVVRYTFNRDVRNVEIVAGEASFVVRKEHRPFEVLSGSLLVHDLSTSFDVYRKRNSTQVTVIEGRIRVIAPLNIESRLKFALAETGSAWKTAPEFHRLQQLEFDEATGTLLVRKDLSESRLAQILAYQRGRIDLTDRTLEEALEEFSRYQPISRFEYSDRSIGKLVVNTNLDFTDLDGLLTALQQEFKVYHTKAGTGTDTVVTLSRHPFRTPENHPRK